MKNNHIPWAKVGNGEIPKWLEWQDQEEGDKCVPPILCVDAQDAFPYPEVLAITWYELA